jgi:hypothetical protein
MKIDLNKKRVIPEVTYSVVENFGWDARDKKQKKIGTITQLQFIDLQETLTKEKSEKVKNEENNN